MKIALYAKALESLHKDRGIGAYTSHLLNALKQYENNNTYVRFNSVAQLSRDVDLVHFTYVDLFSQTLHLPSFRTKTVVTVHDLIPLRYPRQFPIGIRGRINWWMQKRQLHKVDAIVTDSYCSKNDIVRLTSIPAKNIHTIYLAAGERFRVLEKKDKLEKIRVQYNLPEKYLLYVGDLNWNKNVYGLIDALSIVQKRGTKIKLVIVGKAFLDNTIREAKCLNEYIRNSELTDAVIKLGYIAESDLVSVYNLATVYIQPSFYEGFGFPVLEAMNCGVPVIAANCGSLPEVVGCGGILVDPYNIKNMAHVITEMLHYSDNERLDIVKKGFDQARKFTWRKAANQMVALYEQIAGKTD